MSLLEVTPLIPIHSVRRPAPKSKLRHQTKSCIYCTLHKLLSQPRYEYWCTYSVILLLLSLTWHTRLELLTALSNNTGLIVNIGDTASFRAISKVFYICEQTGTFVLYNGIQQAGCPFGSEMCFTQQEQEIMKVSQPSFSHSAGGIRSCGGCRCSTLYHE